MHFRFPLFAHGTAAAETERAHTHTHTYTHPGIKQGTSRSRDLWPAAHKLFIRARLKIGPFGRSCIVEGGAASEWGEMGGEKLAK